MTFYKQFQTDFPTFIINIVRKRIASVCAHISLPGKLSRGSESVKAGGIFGPHLWMLWHGIFPIFYKVKIKKITISNKELIKILSNSIKKNVEN